MNVGKLIQHLLETQRKVRDDLFDGKGQPTYEQFLIALGRDRALEEELRRIKDELEKGNN